jgi:hypothetical protein
MSLSSTDYALLAQDSYHDPVLNKPKELGGIKYEAIDVADNPRTGFQATAYRRMDNGEIIIAYRGTEFKREPVHDGGVDAAMVLGGINLQRGDSEKFTERVLQRAKLEADLHHRPMQVTVTGHSLGGTLAELNASKYGLKGETFNAYGAAGLREGVPQGGSQVIDHVRAGDVVSAASPHFGEVRTYAAQKDIDTLGHAGYRDDGGILSARNPVKAIDFDAHAIDNFVPNSELLGRSIIDPESEARYHAHEHMVDRYRNDVRDIRMGLSASWEIPKAVGEFKDAVAHKAAEAIEDGVEVVGRGVSSVAHEVTDGFEHLKEGVQHVGQDISRGVHAVEEKAAGAWNTLTHPGAWFDHDKPAARLDDPAHPDHGMFKQARDAVHQLDREHGRTPDRMSDQISGAVVVSARRDGLERIDSAVLSDDKARIYAVQGAQDSPLKRVSEVSTEQASRTSVAESSQEWQRVAMQAQQQAQQSPGNQVGQSMLPPSPERPSPQPGI